MSVRRPVVTCTECFGAGHVLLTEPLWRTMLVLVERGEATALDVWKALGDRGMTRNAFNNRLADLLELGLVERRKVGREWVYRVQ